MINLLPPKDRLAIETAKHNTILRRYLELTIIGVTALSILVVGSFYFLNLQFNNTQKNLDLNNSKLKELEPVQEQAQQLSLTIKTISSLLSGDIKFSEMLKQIGQLMPPNSVLSGLELSSVDSKAPLSITAQVDTEEKAAVLRNNLVASQLFDKADIKSITKIGEDATTSGTTSAKSEQTLKDSLYKFIVVINCYFKQEVKK